MSKPREDGWLVYYSRDGQKIISIGLPPEYHGHSKIVLTVGGRFDE